MTTHNPQPEPRPPKPPLPPPAVRAYLARIGARGGAAGTGPAKARSGATIRRISAAGVAARRAKRLAQQQNKPADHSANQKSEIINRKS